MLCLCVLLCGKRTCSEYLCLDRNLTFSPCTHLIPCLADTYMHSFCVGRKVQFKLFKKFFGKKRKESSSSTGSSTWKQSQARQRLWPSSPGPVGSDSEGRAGVSCLSVLQACVFQGAERRTQRTELRLCCHGFTRWTSEPTLLLNISQKVFEILP